MAMIIVRVFDHEASSIMGGWDCSQRHQWRFQSCGNHCLLIGVAGQGTQGLKSIPVTENRVNLHSGGQRRQSCISQACSSSKLASSTH